MGVYTGLYAPIFNYIHMSQAEKTNTSDTSKKPRLYSRGNDQINLDDYVRNLESGFDAWLNSRKIKDKHKDAVREAYREMVTRLNSGDGSFTSRLGGGFQDSTGKIKNENIKIHMKQTTDFYKFNSTNVKPYKNLTNNQYKQELSNEKIIY